MIVVCSLLVNVSVHGNILTMTISSLERKRKIITPYIYYDLIRPQQDRILSSKKLSPQVSLYVTLAKTLPQKNK
jgi:hypothetical protein